MKGTPGEVFHKINGNRKRENKKWQRTRTTSEKVHTSVKLAKINYV